MIIPNIKECLLGSRLVSENRVTCYWVRGEYCFRFYFCGRFKFSAVRFEIWFKMFFMASNSAFCRGFDCILLVLLFFCFSSHFKKLSMLSDFIYLISNFTEILVSEWINYLFYFRSFILFSLFLPCINVFNSSLFSLYVFLEWFHVLHHMMI